MINKTIYNYLLVGLALIVLSSCGKDDTERSTVTSAPMEIASIDDGVTLEESGQVHTINFTLDAGQIVNTKVAIAVDPLKSTAVEGEDFIIAEAVTSVTAYVREGSFQIEILEDGIPEGDETITFVVSGVQDPFGPTNTKEYVLNITDNSMLLTFDWAPFCDSADMDIYVMDAAGTGLGIYDAASASCPESMLIDGWDDGEYFLMQQMYNNVQFGTGANIDYPMTITATKGGVFDETFPADEVWNSDEDDAVNTGTYNFKSAVKLTVAGSVYTLTDSDGSVIVQGLQAPTDNTGKVVRYKDAL